nr:MAG TPA: Hexon-associated protein (IIIa) [Caudoviricetes sp.]
MLYNDANLFFRRLQEYLTSHYRENVLSIYVVVFYPRWMPPTCYITMNKN